MPKKKETPKRETRGRKPLPANQKRSNQIALYLTDRQRKRFESLCKQLGLSKSEVVILKLLDDG